jgi:hypothetical protein|nr:hypothetical protein [Methylobacterium sp. V23]
MTASDYSAQRSQLARDLGLGKSRRATSEAPSPPVDEASMDRDERSADAGQAATQEPIPEPDRGDLDDTFEEEITREPFDDDGVEP